MELGFPGGAVIKNLPANAGDSGPTPEPQRFPGEGNGYPLQYSCLENPTDRGTRGHKESDATEQLTLFPPRVYFFMLPLQHISPSLFPIHTHKHTPLVS